MATFIVAEYCPICDKYFKRVGRGPVEECDICNSPKILKTVEKYSEHDPYRREEVINVCYGENPRYSISLGVSETQIEEARKLHPQVEWKRFGHSFRPLIKNRAEKLKLMKQAGYEEFDTKQFKGREGR